MTTLRYHEHRPPRSGITLDVDNEPGRVLRLLLTFLAFVLLSLPILGLLAASDSVRWGTVPEWIAAVSLVVIAAGTWRLVRERERSDA